ncbi:MAG: AAA family ATPase, partial [Christensenellales bacterium]
GLNDVGKRKVKDFSLGMKQRLGIALALANSPQLLVLDEPVNGLDPVGMVDVRNILKRLNEEKITIFLSSHILAELYQLATDYLIIHRGKIIRQLTSDELYRACRKYIKVTADKRDVLAGAILALYPDIHLEKKNDDSLVISCDRITTADVGALALKEQVTLSNLSLEGDDLEAFYLKTISRGNHA